MSIWKINMKLLHVSKKIVLCMRMSELNLPTVEFKTNLTTYNMSLFSNYAIIFSLKDFLSENLFYIHTKIKIGMHVPYMYYHWFTGTCTC